MSDVAIKIENVKKAYRLGAIGGSTLSAEIESWWARKRGYEDPNSKIGTDSGQRGQLFYALNGVNIEVKKGEALGIIGTNGAGKSTLLKILSRVTAPTEGRVGINGRITSMLEVGTGFHPELTGRENIYMNGAILGMTKKEIDSKVNEIIEFSECGKFIDTPVKRYSSGMYVKLGFSVASHLESEIMIMDEVLAVGDVKFQQKCLNSMIRSSTDDKKTILYVSHNMATIKQLCTRCIVLNHGMVVFDGDVSEAISLYLERNNFDNNSFIDLRDAKRLSDEYGKLLRVKSFEFINSKDATYELECKAKCRMEWTLKSDIEGFQLHVVILDSDYQPVGTMQSAVVNLDRKKYADGINFEFDLSNLCVGRYFFILNLLHVNEYGGVGSYDEPFRYISFVIVESGKRYSIAWDRNKMGNIRLNKIVFDD